MATQITPQADALSVTPTVNNADATGNYVTVGPNDRVMLIFKNTSGSIVTVTLDDPTSTTPESATAFNPDVAISVAATTGIRVVRLTGARLRRFRDPATNRINWTYSAATNVTVEAYAVI